MNKKTSFKFLLSKCKLAIILGLIALSIADLAQLAIPLVIERVVDVLTSENARIQEITKYSVYFLIIGIIISLFGFFWRYFILGAARKIEFTLRNDFFSHLQSLDFNFFSERRTGDIMAHIVNDIEAIRTACGLGIILGFEGIFLLFLIIAAMLYVSPQLTLYVLIPFPILVFVILKFGRMIEERFKKVQASFSKLTETAREIISAIKVIKARVKEREVVKNFDSQSMDYLTKNIQLIKIWGVYVPLITFVPGISVGIFLWIGGKSAISQDITLGDFAAILFYLVMLIWPVLALGWAVDIFKRGNASITRINELFSLPPYEVHDTNLIEHEIEGQLEFRNVCFSYNGVTALKNLNLYIPMGTSLGITGTTGSGKTTLITILLKIKELQEGQILVDGVDIKKLKREFLMKNIISVPQEATVFSGTINENISFMNQNVSERGIVEASKIAGIYDEIMEFPGGFNATVGERGLSLSGGQRQRVLLARAILLRPKVLILDDVLYSLDLRTESLVLKNLRRFMSGKTLIVISSRVPSISSFDKIAVFDNGRVIEVGNHDELMANRGIYEKLFNIHTFNKEVTN